MNQFIQRNEPVQSTTSRRPRAIQLGKIRVRTLLLILLGLCVLGLGRTYWLWKAAPVYWQEHQVYLQNTTKEQRMAIAQSVEQRILDQLNFVADNTNSSTKMSQTNIEVADASNAISAVIGSVEPGKANVVFITLEEINAWMDQRLRDWVSHQGASIPDYVSDPMLAIEGKNLIFAFRFDKPDFKQVISAVTRVQLETGKSDKAGKTTIRVIKIRAGKLRIPGADALSSQFGKRVESSSKYMKVASEVTEAFDGMVFDPLIKISQQKIRVASFTLQQNPAGIEMTVKAEDS